jgi:zinc/manganese transport system permease protein
MTGLEFLADPAMKRALVAACLVSLSGAPLGVMLVLRRMSLMGDVIAHAILPGTAAGFILAGMSFTAMGIGGLIAGLLVAFAAGLATRFTAIREDANLASFYLISVAVGILMLALHGSAQDLEDVLFGDARNIDAAMLIVMAVVTGVTLLVAAVIYRPLVVESFDPVFMRSVRGKGGLYHMIFMMLVVLNMVEGYRALGTLMASGLLIIPAVIAQFWARGLSFLMACAVLIAAVASTIGLEVAASSRVPSGPAIVLVLGIVYVGSILFGRYGSLRARYFPFRHLEH